MKHRPDGSFGQEEALHALDKMQLARRLWSQLLVASASELTV